MAEKVPGGGTRSLILEAGRRQLLADGYAGLSTRKVAERPGCRSASSTTTSAPSRGCSSPCSRTRTSGAWSARPGMYADDRPLWERYEQACDFLEDDLDSGYVRVLQEMIATAGRTPRSATRSRSCCAAGIDC